MTFFLGRQHTAKRMIGGHALVLTILDAAKYHRSILSEINRLPTPVEVPDMAVANGNAARFRTNRTLWHNT